MHYKTTFIHWIYIKLTNSKYFDLHLPMTAVQPDVVYYFLQMHQATFPHSMGQM